MANNYKENNYWNKTDCEINTKYLHTLPVYSKQDLSNYYQYYNIKDIRSLTGLKRYSIENNNKPLTPTMQGSVYSAIDVLTGRRVIIKCAQKNLVHKHISQDGTLISEDIRKEAQILHYISKHRTSDASMFIYFCFC